MKKLIIVLTWLFLVINLQGQGGYSVRHDSAYIKLSEKFNRIISENTRNIEKPVYVVSSKEGELDRVEFNIRNDGNDKEQKLTQFESVLTVINSKLTLFNSSQDRFEVYVYIEENNDIDQRKNWDAGKNKVPDGIINEIPQLNDNSNQEDFSYLNESIEALETKIRYLLESSEIFSSGKRRILIGISNLYYSLKSTETETYDIEKSTLFTIQSLDESGNIQKWNEEEAETLQNQLISDPGTTEIPVEIIDKSLGMLEGMEFDDFIQDLGIKTISERFLNLDKKSVSFLSPMGKVISIERDSINSIQFVYGIIDDFGGQVLFDNPMISGGLLIGFSYGSQKKEYTYNFQSKKYQIHIEDIYEDKTRIEDVDGFLYPLAWSGSFLLYKFKRNNIEKDNGEGALVYFDINELYKIFTPFANGFDLSINYWDEINPYSFDLNGDEQALNFKLTIGHGSAPEIFYLDKIFQIACAYPLLYREFVGGNFAFENSKDNTPWGEVLLKNPEKASLKSENYTLYCQFFLESFVEFLTEDKQFWANYNEDTPNSKLDLHLKNEFLDDTQNVPFEKRMLAIEKLLTESSTHFYPYSFNLLMATCVKSWEESFFVKHAIIQLNEGTKYGLACLWTKFHLDNITKGTDRLPINQIDSSRFGFVTIFQEILETLGELKQKEETYLYFINNPDLMVTLESDLLKFKQNLNYQIDNYGNFQIFDIANISYDEIIPINVAGTFTVGGVTMTKGIALDLPIMQAALYADMNNKTVEEKAFWVVLNTGLMFVGVGEVMTAIRASQVIKSAVTGLAIVGDGLGLYAQLANEDAISQQTRKKINIASVLLNLPVLVNSIPKISRLVDELDEVLKAKKYAKANEAVIIEKQIDIGRKILQRSDIDADFFDELMSARNATCDYACSLAKYGCFTENTPVMTTEGKKPIKNITVQDKVLSFNHKTRRNEMRTVTAIKNYIVTAILAIVLSNSDTLWATPDHPFWSIDRYVSASELRDGDHLTTCDNMPIQVENIIYRDTSVRVYNITVEGNNNYYAGHTSILVHNDCFLKKLDAFPTLKAQLDELSGVLKGQFLEDFVDAGDDVLGFLNKEGGVRAWEKAIDFVNVRKDIDFLKSFSKALDDVNLAGPPINIENRIKDWIQNSHLKCKSCTTGSEPFLDDVLDNLYDFRNHLSKPGAIEVLDDIGASTKGAEGANWLMKFVKDREINPSAFEEIVTDGKMFTADIVENVTEGVKKYFECKSWDAGMKGLFTTGKTNFCSQLLNYLHNPDIKNLDQIGFYFNPSKWTPSAADMNAALKAKPELFITNNEIIWRKYLSFVDDNIDNIPLGDINALIDKMTSPSIFNKIINPI